MPSGSARASLPSEDDAPHPSTSRPAAVQPRQLGEGRNHDGIPTTTNRVPAHTQEEANRKILERTEENISIYTSSGPDAIERRLKELDREWDAERCLEANAAGFSLLGLTLGALVSRKWFIFPGIISGFLLQHAIQGWCPPLYLLRKWGVRTATEIDYERYALKAARGDFAGISDPGKGQPVAAGTILQAVKR